MLGMLLGAALAAAPPQDSVPGFTTTALRITPALEAPVLDGRLDDAVWAAADSVSGFVQREPHEGQPALRRTVARVAFDAEAVYVAVRAYDPEPHRVVAQLTRRDEDSSSDWIFVGLDSRHDLRTAYFFAVNPAGVKRDFLASEGADDDAGWDAVWDVATRRDELGWTAEYRIPLSALRFSEGGDGQWGFQVMRMVQRDREMSSWAPMRRDDPRVIAHFGVLQGMRGLPSPRRLEVLPYTVSGVSRTPRQAGSPFWSANDLRGAAGMDLKYGVTSDLTLDVTVNPDFGQVEADPSQVNLSAFETFLSERRPFFSEGAEIFRFGLSLGDGDDAVEQLFYSRRIGRAPQGSATDRGGFDQVPAQTTILGAGKLSGRVGRDWSVGVMGALTSQEHARVSDSAGGRFEDVVEPLSGYTVARVRRSMNGGRTQAGAIGTGVFRRLDGTAMEDELRSSAYAGGMDLSHRTSNDVWYFHGYLLGSYLRGTPEAVAAAQTSSARYFQRPDADYVAVDSSATSLGGWAAQWEASKIKGWFRASLLGQARSPGFETNDVGYLREADVVEQILYMGLRKFQPGRWIRNGNLNVNTWAGWDFGGDRTSLGGNVNGYARLLNYWETWGGIGHNRPVLDTRALRGGPAMMRPARWNGWWGMSTDGRKPLSASLNLDGGVQPEAGSQSWYVGVGTTWRPSSRTRLSLSPSYSRNESGWQYVTQQAAVDGTHYVFSELDQRTLALSARLNHTFTPVLSLQLYAQPFLSAGRYRSFKEVADPRAARFADRFHPYADGEVRACGETLGVRPSGEGCGGAAGFQFTFDDPDFNVRDFNLNAVLRWEYRLGSTLYVAWSHARGGSETDGRFRPRHDLGELFGTPSTNVLLVKVNYWLSM